MDGSGIKPMVDSFTHPDLQLSMESRSNTAPTLKKGEVDLSMLVSSLHDVCFSKAPTEKQWGE